MRIDMDKILNEYSGYIDEFTTKQVMERYDFTYNQLLKMEAAEYLNPRTDAYGTIFWLREELDLVSHDVDALEDFLLDTEAARMLGCHYSDLDQLEVALNPKYVSGIRIWDKEAIEALIDTHEVDE